MKTTTYQFTKKMSAEEWKSNRNNFIGAPDLYAERVNHKEREEVAT